MRGASRRRKTTRKQKGGALCDPTDKEDIYTLGEKVDKSTWDIFSDSTNKDLLIKLQGGVDWRMKENIERDFAVSKRAGELGVAPRVHYTTLCKDKSDQWIGYMVMDRIIGGPIPEDDAEKIAEVNRLLDILYDSGITHGDVSYKNAMYGHTSTNATDRVWIIDFDMATVSPAPIPKNDREYLEVA